VAILSITSTTVWEIRDTASTADLNGGGFDPTQGAGTDYSQQDAPILTVTDGNSASTTNLNSVTGGFTAAMQWNTLQITGGTLTAGVYQIVAFVNSNNVTLDRALNTGSGSTVRVGGAFATPGFAGAQQVTSNTFYIRRGHNPLDNPYTFSSTSNISGGRLTLTQGGLANKPMRVIGYDTNRTPANTDPPPELDVGASMAGVTVQMIFCNSNNVRVHNFKFRNPGAFAGGAVSTMLHLFGQNCVGDRCDIDLNNVTNWLGVFSPDNSNAGFNILVDHANNLNNNIAAFASQGPSNFWAGCVARNGSNGAPGWDTLGSSISGVGRLYRCLSYKNGGDGFRWFQVGGQSAIQCAAKDNGGNGFTLFAYGSLIDCISSNNGGNQFANQGSGSTINLKNCAGFVGTGGANIGPGIFADDNADFVTLTQDPFVNPAGGNFNLNAAAGGGAACVAVGYPQSFLGLPNTTDFPDIGLVQTKGGTGFNDTNTVITSSSQPATPGTAIKWTATVTSQVGGGGLPTPSGTVQFSIDGVAFGSPVTLDGSGVAVSGLQTFTTSGNHTIKAAYSGDGAVFDASNGFFVQVVQTTGVAVPPPPPTRLTREDWHPGKWHEFAQELAAYFQQVPGLAKYSAAIQEIIGQ